MAMRGWPQDPAQASGEVGKKFQMTYFTMPNNSCSMKYSLKSVPGLADVRVLHGDGPKTSSRCLEGGQEKVSNDLFYYA